MTKRMLIDATHAEETRVVVLDGHRLEDFDVETSTKRQLKGNIYLAKVVRVEPSLQAAFVEYGGGRHGFLAFGEIHPDYYQIPVADRQRLLEIAAEDAREEEEAEDRREAGWAVRTEQPAPKHHVTAADVPVTSEAEAVVDATSVIEVIVTDAPHSVVEAAPVAEHEAAEPAVQAAVSVPNEAENVAPANTEETEKPATPQSGRAQPALIPAETRYGDADALPIDPDVQSDLDFAAETHSLPPNVTYAGDAEGAVDDGVEPDQGGDTAADSDSDSTIESQDEDAAPPETVGGESDQFEGNGAEEASRRRASRMLRSYRIQEVIRRRQILLIQVVKEERGTKGAALTTYISLAGRYCVLMPNSPRGGGISRKITSAADRKRLKEITAEMEIPKGMGLIVRTAGAARPKPEIRRDCEYLMRLWDDIRDQTMRSMAPALIYEEASLIKRSIRDVYSRDIDEVIVDGEEGWKQAHDIMRMLMPSHAKKVQLWRPAGIATPLFAKYQVDLQLDAMLAPTVQLKSGGYLVINQTEALVAIDVNSGRSTRERGIEETALKTNLEAADEVARQLRLRDLAGLIVIDFIDMEARKANAMVERRMKDALKNDRARIQLGAISHFGLMEMSRQRLRPSLTETSFVTCPHCNGMGHVRSVESAAIHVLRSVEEEGSKLRAAAILVFAASPVVMYILNHKRDRLTEIEARYAMRISFGGDDTLLPPAVRIDRLRPQVADAERLLTATAVAVAVPVMDSYDGEEDEDDLVLDEVAAVAPSRVARQETAPAETEAGTETAAQIEEGEQRRRRRRRRRGGRRDGTAETSTDATALAGDDAAEGDEGEDESFEPAGEAVRDAAPEAAADAVTDLLVEAKSETAETGGLIPAGEQVELDENGEPKSRRRGRRGGRRRRRVDGEPGSETAEAGDENTPVEALETPQVPPAPPAYVGPTPANPFNNTYDIFDLLEQAQEAAAQAPVVKQVPIMKAPPVAAPTPVVPDPVAAEPAAAFVVSEPAGSVPMPEPLIEARAEIVPLEEIAMAPVPEIAAEATLFEGLPEPEPAPAPAKRGWWRR